jgi:4-amino-4-deoxy-L-arabinose transferase-like glycosyltransferase
VAPDEVRRRHRTVHLRAVVFLGAYLIGVFYLAPVPTDWDAWDYSAQAIRGHSSDLLLGRWWFIAAMRLAYLVVRPFSSGPLDAFTAMSTLNGLFFAGGTVVLMAWTRRLTRSALAETVAALLVLAGPMMGIYAMSIMTEPMTLAALAGAFYCWHRALDRTPEPGAIYWALGAGACLGVAADIREPAALLALWPIVSVAVQRPRRAPALLAAAVLAGLLTLGLGVWMAWQWYPVEYTGRTFAENIRTWTADMAGERRAFAIEPIRQLRFLAEYSLASSPPAALLLLPAAVWAGLRRDRTFWIFLASLGYLATLLANHDLGVNPRFALPWIWVNIPLCAAASRRGIRALAARAAWARGLALGLGLVSALAAHGATFLLMRDVYFGYARGMARQYQVLQALPEDALVIAGPGTPIAFHLKRLGRKDFRVVASGWSWPENAVELCSRIDDAIARGRVVMVNMDPDDWNRVRRDSGELEMILQAARRYRQIPRPDLLPLVQWVPTR